MSPFGSLPLQCFPDAAPHIEEAEALGLTGTAKEVRDRDPVNLLLIACVM